MEKIVFRVLVITSACSLSAKHVFVQNRRKWSNAQQYCRDHHTELSPITSELEEKVFRDIVGEDKAGWIGLYWESSNQTWSWSGGVQISNGVQGMVAAVWWTRGIWLWRHERSTNTFFCLNLVVVQEEKTWEEALEHCRETHSNLTSLLSETENLLAQTEIQHGDITERVWVGLRYLEDSWLWVNGHPLEYEAWNQGGDQCPIWRGCGALNKEGTWENRDCRERLNFICA